VKTTFKSAAIRCGGCANNIRANLVKNPGVAKVEVDPATKRVDVEYDEAVTRPEVIADALAFLGYPAEVAAN
jgi:copper chaperone CopZ